MEFAKQLTLLETLCIKGDIPDMTVDEVNVIACQRSRQLVFRRIVVEKLLVGSACAVAFELQEIHGAIDSLWTGPMRSHLGLAHRIGSTWQETFLHPRKRGAFLDPCPV